MRFTKSNLQSKKNILQGSRRDDSDSLCRAPEPNFSLPFPTPHLAVIGSFTISSIVGPTRLNSNFVEETEKILRRPFHSDVEDNSFSLLL